jgi:4-amino-4-deoxy-L-arabinose transferase-like glycosyltransferase
VLGGQFLGLGLVEAWQDSPTFDEPFFLASGVTALTRHQLRITPEHPPLPKLLAALPVLLAHPAIPSGPGWQSGVSGAYAQDFINAQARTGKLRRVVFLGRLVPLLEAALVGWCIYALGTTLFARSAGLLAAAVWFTTPLSVGLGHLNGGDIPFTLVTLVVCLALAGYLRSRTWAALALLGLSCGAALLTRLTALALVPAVALIVVAVSWRRLRRGLLGGATVLLIAWACVWAGVRMVSPTPQFRHTAPVGAVRGPLPTPARAALLVPWPHEFETGIRDQAGIAKSPAPAFLLGHAWNGIRWWFWPASLIIKLPESTLLLVLAGAACWVGLGRRRVQTLLLVLGVPAVAVAAVAVLSPRQIGLRYLLPVIALAIVAAGPIVRIVGKGSRRLIGYSGIGLLMALQLLWLWSATPHSLAWTTPPFRPGYQVAADSNLDWGQDLYGLAAWVKGRHTSVASFGLVDPTLVVPGARPLTLSQPPSGWVAVSASLLTTLFRKPLAWLRAYCPVRTIGGTILIYRFDHPVDLRPRGDRPAGVCPGSASYRR